MIEDDQDENFYKYSYLETTGDLTVDEAKEFHPIYEEHPIAFCYLENPNSDFMFSIWKYITFSYIEERSVRFIFPMFGEDYDYENLMAQMVYLN